MIYTYLSKRDDHSAGAYMFLHIKGFGDEMCQYYQELQKKKRQK